nr:uncharacterized protein LOC112210977 [Halyomorpha halys]
MTKERWTPEDKVRLIDLYKDHSLLWDPTDVDHKNNHKRRDAFNNIARELGVESVDLVKKKMDSFLIQYRREMRSTLAAAGPGFKEKKKSSWWGVPYFEFLRDIVQSIIEREIRSAKEPVTGESLSSDSSRSSSPLGFEPFLDGEEVYQIMKECYEEIKQAKERDQHTIYSENLANRLRKIKDGKRLCVLKNKIDNLIFDAEMEELNEHY